MVRRGSTSPRVVAFDGAVTPLVPIELTDRVIDEARLQAVMDLDPGLLPLQDVVGTWGPVTSLGREIGVEVGSRAGYIDNLFVSANGDITVVEAKLWRNPEARRKVVAQVLDYAAALSKLTFAGLDELVLEACDDDRGIWERALESFDELRPDDEADFVDAVNRNLEAGRMLLLVVGDGIKSELEDLTELLTRRSGLGFHLELVEMKLYRLPSLNEAPDQLLVVPRLVARTAEIERTVVLATVEGKAMSASREVIDLDSSPAAATSGKRRRLTSIADFVEFSTTEIADQGVSSEAAVAEARAMGELAGWWEQQPRGRLAFTGTTSMRLDLQLGDRAVPFFKLWGDGMGTLNYGYFQNWAPAIGQDLIARLFGPLDFDRSEEAFPTRRLGLHNPASWDSLTAAMDTLAGHILAVSA